MKNLVSISISIILMMIFSSCAEEEELNPDEETEASGLEASGGLWDNVGSSSRAYVVMTDFVDMTVTTSDVRLSTGEIGGLDYTDVLIRPEDNSYLLKVRFFEIADEGDHNYPEAGSYTLDYAKIESFDQQMIIADITWFEPNYGFIFAINEFTEATFDLEYINGEDIDVSFDIVFNADDNSEQINTIGVARVR